jgi:glycosyltransferase involved in cell wall biosynthesis
MYENPVITILTPSYNQGRFIEETIISIKNQTYPFIEHIIIDGNSSDNTIDVIKSHEKDYNLTWISEKDDGQAEAIEKGLLRAKGSILTWINSDDYYLSNTAIEKIMNVFIVNQDIDILTGTGIYIDEKGSFLDKIETDKKYLSLLYMKRADFILQPSTFFRKKTIENIAINKKCTYVFDWLLFLNMLENGFKISWIDDFISAYRIHSTHKTGDDNSRRRLEIALLMKRNYGKKSISTMYCFGIYYLYILIERTSKKNQQKIKPVIRKINRIFAKISDYKLYSC